MTIKTIIITSMLLILSGCSISYTSTVTSPQKLRVVSIQKDQPSVDLLNMATFDMYYNYPISPDCINLFKTGDILLMDESVNSFNGMTSKKVTIPAGEKKKCF